MLAAALITSFLVLAATLMVRAIGSRMLLRYRLFYSYIAYMLTSGVVVTILYLWAPASYPSAGWLRFLLSLLVEFAVLVEISDHIFSPYPAIRRLGRALTLGIGAILFAVYIAPAFFELRPASELFLELGTRVSLVKLIVLMALLTAAASYRLPLGRNISGMMLGFAIYLAINVANFAAASQFGKDLYARILSILVPVSYNLCLLVWTIALWRYEPAASVDRSADGEEREFSSSPGHQLVRFNSVLIRLLRR